MYKYVAVFAAGLLAGYLVSKKKFDKQVAYIEDVYSCMSCGTEEDVEIDEDTLYDEEYQKYEAYLDEIEAEDEVDEQPELDCVYACLVKQYATPQEALEMVEQQNYTLQYMTFYKGDNVWVDENGADCDELGNDEGFIVLARRYSQDEVAYLVNHRDNIIYETHIEDVCFYEEDEAND